MAQGPATHFTSISGLNSHLSEPEKALSHRCLNKDRLFIYCYNLCQAGHFPTYCDPYLYYSMVYSAYGP